jgi:hypothetical protein
MTTEQPANVQPTNKKSNKGLWIGLGGALVFCLCAVGALVLVFGRIGQQVKQGMKTDPAAAAQSAHNIADYELPAGYQEQMAMDLLVYNMVFIGPPSGSSSDQPLIMLAQFKTGANQEQMEQQIQQSFERQSGQRGFQMKVVETKKMTIRGEEVEVITYEGTNDSGDTMRQVITTFPGKGGTAMLMIMGDTQYWDKEAIDKFIESIH